MSKQPSTFDSTASVLHRLFSGADPSVSREPACNAAVIFSTIVQARAIDRLTAAVEKNTHAILLASDGALSPRKKQELLEGGHER